MKYTGLKRIICMVLALMLILPVLASYAFAQETEQEIEITKQPSAVDPSIELSNATGAVYQWYEYAIERTEITPDIAQGYRESEYTQNGWTPTERGSVYAYFDVDVSYDDIIVIPIENGINSYSFYNDYGETIPVRIVDNELVFESDESGIYTLTLHADEPSTVKAYFQGKSPQMIEGQTGSALTEYEFGKEYFVQVGFGENTITSDTFEMVYSITEHPTKDTLSVTTNAPNNISKHEWYYVGKGGDVYAVEYDNNSIFASYIYNGKFRRGLWYGDNDYINIVARGIAGDILKIKVGDGVNASVGLYDDKRFAKDENGIFYYEFTEEKELDFEISARDDLGAVEIYIERGENKLPVVFREIISEKTMELAPVGLMYGYYNGSAWKCSASGFVVLELDIDKDGAALKIEGADERKCLVSERSKGNDIERNENGLYEVDSGGYIVQIWGCSLNDEIIITLVDGEKEYEVVEKLNTYDDETGTVNVWYINDGRYEDGKWYPYGENEEIDIEFALEKGYILEIVTSDNFDGDVTLDVSNSDGLEIGLERVNGKYVFVAGKYLDFDLELENCKNEFSAEIRVIKGTPEQLEAEVSSTVTPYKLGYYFVNVKMDNGTELLSRSFELSECDHSYNINALKCDEQTNCSVCNEAFEAIGHNYSEWKTVKYAETGVNGSEARACSACGSTESRETPALEKSGVGKGVIFIIIGSGFGLGAVSVGAAWFVLKKKSLKK